MQMVESSDDEFEYFVESVLVSFDKVSVKDAIYVREYDPIYDNTRMNRYFITKKSFFMYINKIFNCYLFECKYSFCRSFES